jgi:hypothetical protein
MKVDPRVWLKMTGLNNKMPIYIFFIEIHMEFDDVSLYVLYS